MLRRKCTLTAPASYPQRGRTAESQACLFLSRKGYSVFRTMRYSTSIHLVAWCERTCHLLLVHVRRTRHEVIGIDDVMRYWRDDVRALQDIPRWDGIEVELWVYTGSGCWHIFTVYPGGIAEEGQYVDRT